MTSTRFRLLLMLLFLCFAAIDARADLQYTFSYAAVTGPVQSFSFSFTAPTFVTGGSPAFTPFTPSDGTNNWTMTQALAAVLDPGGLNLGCFEFGTPFAELTLPPPFGGPCSFAVGGPGTDQAAFEVALHGGLPAALGTYTSGFVIGSFDTAAGFEFINPVNGTPTGTMSLTISDVPESSDFSVAVTLFVGLGVLLKRKNQPKPLSGLSERAG